MPKLKILHLADFRWYNATAHYALTISQALAQNGHQVYLGLISRRNFPYSVKSDPNLFIFDSPLQPGSPLTWLKTISSLNNLISEQKIRLVNAHSASSHLLAALLKARAKNKFKLIRTRGDAFPPKQNLFNRFLYDRLSDLIIVPSSILAERCKNHLRIAGSKIIHIPLGLELLKKSNPGPATDWKVRLGIRTDEKIVGIIGRLSPVKGHIYYIQAAKSVLEIIPNVKFIIAGPEAQISHPRLKKLAYQMGVIDRFTVLGLVENIDELISIFDVGVVCSIGSETICRVVLEYMSSGKPVIGTTVNGIPDLIKEGENGFQVSPADSPELASALVKILKDEQLGFRMGKYSQHLVETEYNLKKFAERTEAAYLRLLEEWPSKNREE